MSGFRVSLEHARRARQAKAPAAPPATPVPAPKAAEAKPVKPPAPKLRHCCGHEQTVANITARPCPQCMRRARLERGRRQAQRHAQRLPDGARFVVAYDAATQTWTGTLELMVPGQADAQRFEGSASGVFHLLRDLDQQFRQLAIGAPAPPPARQEDQP
jgi:hypothetical protein